MFLRRRGPKGPKSPPREPFHFENVYETRVPQDVETSPQANARLRGCESKDNFSKVIRSPPQRSVFRTRRKIRLISGSSHTRKTPWTTEIFKPTPLPGS